MKRSLETITSLGQEAWSAAAPSTKREKVAFTDELLLDLMRVEVTGVALRVDPAAVILGRIKTKASLYEKAQRQHVGADLIHDKVGLRVIVSGTEQCFTVVDRLHARLDALDKHFDDYVTRPKANGYRALHTILIGPAGKSVEVQVRSKDMHSCAESGSACHGLYKSRQISPAPFPWSMANDLRSLASTEGTS